MRAWVGNLLLVVGSVMVTLVVAELVLQFVYPSHATWRLHRIPDRELGWVLEPGAHYTRHVPGTFVDVRYNSEGFRDSEPTDASTKTGTRIVVLGDSFMEANMVPLGQVFHKQLERMAAADGKSLTTYNLGVAGYGTLQEYLTFRKSGGPRKPDLVLLAFFLHNDIVNNAEHMNLGPQAKRGGKRKRPFLDESDETQWRIRKPDYDYIQQRYLRNKNSWSFRLKHDSVLLTLVRHAGRALKSKTQAFHGRGALAMHRCDSATSHKQAWATTERILKRLKQEIESAGARLVVFSVPALFDSDMVAARELERLANDKQRVLCVEESPGYRELSSILERNDIAYVDLVPAFRDAVTNSERSMFVRGDWHWNGEGHELAARRVYDALRSRGYLPD